jgi:flagellar biosynthesis regulator FlaF
MPNIKNTDPSEISDEAFETASQYVEQTVNILDMELRTSNIPIGMFLVGMARFMGHEIRKATSALGPERRREQITAFSKIIEVNAMTEDSDGETPEI